MDYILIILSQNQSIFMNRDKRFVNYHVFVAQINAALVLSHLMKLWFTFTKTCFFKVMWGLISWSWLRLKKGLNMNQKEIITKILTNPVFDVKDRQKEMLWIPTMKSSWLSTFTLIMKETKSIYHMLFVMCAGKYCSPKVSSFLNHFTYMYYLRNYPS